MASERTNDPRAFKGFIDRQIANGEADLTTVEEALALWEYENSPEEEREETIRAIQRGLDEMYAGRTTDAFEFVERMRRKLRAAAKR